METTNPVEAEGLANATKTETAVDQPKVSPMAKDLEVESLKPEKTEESEHIKEPPAKKLKSEASNTPAPEQAKKDEPPMHEMVGGSSVRQYLNKHLTAHVLEGLKQVSKDKPQDPLRALGEFLLQRSKEVEGHEE